MKANLITYIDKIPPLKGLLHQSRMEEVEVFVDLGCFEIVGKGTIEDHHLP